MIARPGAGDFYLTWDAWAANLPELSADEDERPDSYLGRLRRHIEKAPDPAKATDEERRRAISLLNRRARGLAKVSYDASLGRVVVGLPMAALAFASTLIAPLAPAMGIAGVVLAMNEIRIYIEGCRVNDSRARIEALIDALVDGLEANGQ